MTYKTGFRLIPLIVTTLLFTGCGPSEEMLVGRGMLSYVRRTQYVFTNIYIAAKRYRFSEGAYPTSLSELVASKYYRKWVEDPDRSHIIEKTPDGYIIVDERSRKPLKYVCPGKVWPDAFDVYAFGPNGIDDGGEYDDVTSWDLLERDKRSRSCHARENGVVQVKDKLMQIWKKERN